MKQHIAREKLGKNAAKRPHINLVVIAASKNYFGGAVGSRLNIAAQMVMDETRATEVNYFDFASGIGFNQNVLWL
jgi:hypothetical protein